jgi:uncharacterized membrane protein YbhN (UPF0104 family)
MRAKSALRWFALGVALLFLLHTLRARWHEMAGLQLTSAQWGYCAMALLVTAIAHVWSGLVWLSLLRALERPLPLHRGLRLYLNTNLAKYVPGNIWHFYGRIEAVKAAGSSLGTATLSVLLEPLLMVAAAGAIALAAAPLPALLPIAAGQAAAMRAAGLVAIGSALRPRYLNGLLQRRRLAGKDEPLRLSAYPLRPLLGELGFVALRGAGFALTVAAFAPVPPAALPLLLGAFAAAWGLGLVVPTPGGIGTFEASAVALLQGPFAAGALLGAVVAFRLVSIAAEAAAAGLASLLVGRP